MTASRKIAKKTLDHARQCFNLRARDTTLSLGKKTLLMGIVNVTPDSFSHDGLLRKGSNDPRAHLAYASKLIDQGADIIDVGGESTRPGAQTVTIEQELQRVIPLIRLLAKKTAIPISIDTYKPLVARQAIDAGASIVNIIQGTSINKKMLDILKRTNVAVVLMHMRNTPRTMQQHIHYGNLIVEIIDELGKSVQKCLESGINSDRIIIDPGIGFCKTTEHNLIILKHLRKFSSLRLPILIGTSRKSFIGKVLGHTDPQKRTWGTAATVSSAILSGAHIIRVHDIASMRDVARVADAIIKPENFRNQ